MQLHCTLIIAELVAGQTKLLSLCHLVDRSSVLSWIESKLPIRSFRAFFSILCHPLLNRFKSHRKCIYLSPWKYCQRHFELLWVPFVQTRSRKSVQLPAVEASSSFSSNFSNWLRRSMIYIWILFCQRFLCRDSHITSCTSRRLSRNSDSTPYAQKTVQLPKRQQLQIECMSIHLAYI